MIIYLVRHGLSEANVARRVTGTPKDGLVDIGRLQALNLRTWILEAGIAPNAYFVSHWRRARETADVLFPGAPWVVDERIGETSAGDVADMSLGNFREMWPDFYDSPRNAYPGGESHLDLDARVRVFMQGFQGFCGQSAIVVTHSGPISCILQKACGVGMERFPVFLPAHASVSALESVSEGEAGSLSFRLRAFSVGPLANLSCTLGNG